MIVDVLPSGEIPARPSELLSSQVMIDLLSAVRREYDLVLIDTPALLPVTDAAAVAPHADGVLLVVRYGRTTSSQVETATNALKAVSGTLLGTVINMVPGKSPNMVPGSPRIHLERWKAALAGSHAAGDKVDGPQNSVSDQAAKKPAGAAGRSDSGVGSAADCHPRPAP